MEKYEIVRRGLQEHFKGTNLVFKESPLARFDELSTTHCPEYIKRFECGNLKPIENRRIGFPWSVEGVKRSLSSVGGTVAAMRTVCNGECDVSGHIAGGTHHAFYDYGEGFCVFSDIAVAANVALRDYPNLIKKILIIDLDVHQGNGNAVLFKDSSKVFTFSAHCLDNYFSEKRNSSVDVEFKAGCKDDEYLSTIQSWMPKILEMATPDLVFFQGSIVL